MSMETLREKCVALKRQQAIKEELEERLAEVNKIIERLAKGEIPELMESLQVKTATFEGLGRVQLASDLYASTKEGKKEEAMQWLRDCGYDGLITETYNASSIKAIFRNMLREGAEIPDSIFNITPFMRASVVKA